MKAGNIIVFQLIDLFEKLGKIVEFRCVGNKRNLPLNKFETVTIFIELLGINN